MESRYFTIQIVRTPAPPGRVRPYPIVNKYTDLHVASSRAKEFAQWEDVQEVIVQEHIGSITRKLAIHKRNIDGTIQSELVGYR